MADDYSDTTETTDTSDVSSDTSDTTDTTDYTADDTSNDVDLSDDGSDEISDGDSETEVEENNDDIEDGDVGSDTENDETGNISDTPDDTESDGSENLPDGNEDISSSAESDSRESVDNNNGNADEFDTLPDEYFDENGRLKDISDDEYNNLSDVDRAKYDLEYANRDAADYAQEKADGFYNPEKEQQLSDALEDRKNNYDDVIQNGGVRPSDDEFDRKLVGGLSGVGSKIVGKIGGLDPVTNGEVSKLAGQFGENYGADALKRMSETGYAQQGSRIPNPQRINVSDENGTHTELLENYKPTENGDNDDIYKSREFNELKNDYFNDLKSKSEFPNTIDDSIKDKDWTKINPELNGEMRDEFGNVKNKLINDWETKNNQKWPTYNNDVYSPNGKLIRHEGDRYDAHHIQPLTFGGVNDANNITPLHANEHFDKQGVHSPDSPFGKMERFK